MKNEDIRKNISDREILYSFWKTLPVLHLITSPREDVFSHDVRVAIIRFLRKGQTEKTSEKDAEEKRRYAFNAREILQHLQEDEKLQISLQSLYFHLQKLTDFGLIQNVVILREGKHNTAYIGRTARFFLFVDLEKEYKKYISRFSAIFQLVQLENPDIQLERAEKYLKKYLDIKRERQKQLSEWLVQKESLITEGNLDLTDLFAFLDLIDSINPKYQTLFKKISEYLGLEF
ncbi:MAG: hypothetical protein ACFFC7_09620 [Candidatus Hermodarchaeota archaeon]